MELKNTGMGGPVQAVTSEESWDNDYRDAEYMQLESMIENRPRFPGDLENLRLYLDKLNHPERDLRVIHVAGTNGKGSVCAFLDSILSAAGYRTAMFTSPHLLTLRERFRICGRMVSKDKLVRAWQRVAAMEEEVDSRSGHGLKRLAFFELLFVLGLLVFREEKPDYLILETGMGGRLDPTVLCCPILCIITSISLDHTGTLGETIQEIAGEKAGIIKAGIPVLALDDGSGVISIFRQTADKIGTNLHVLNSGDVHILKKCENYIDFSIDNSYYKLSVFRVCSMAGYQTVNGSLAAMAARILLPDLTDEIIGQGLVSMRWPGRMQELLPGIFVDGAHNPQAIAAVVNDIRDRGGRWSLLFSVYEDKDYRQMISLLADFPFVRTYVTGLHDRRGASSQELVRLFEEYSFSKLSLWSDAASAFEAAQKDKNNDEYLLCTGSLHLVGEVMQRVQIITESEDRQW